MGWEEAQTQLEAAELALDKKRKATGDAGEKLKKNKKSKVESKASTSRLAEPAAKAKANATARARLAGQQAIDDMFF